MRYGIICIICIFLLGIMMVFNTSSAEVLEHFRGDGTHKALLRQIIYSCIGIGIGFGFKKIGFRHLLKLSPFLFILSIFMLILVLIPGIGIVRNGARRWLGVGGVSFQPSEFAKLFLLLFYVEWFRKCKYTVDFFTFVKGCLIFCIPIALVIIEPDNGTAAVMLFSLVPLFFVSKIKYRYWVIPMVCTMCAGCFVAYRVPYVRARLAVYLNPDSDIRGKGHQPRQAKIAVGSGKIIGKGPGGSLQKFTYLPEAQNDYIAAIFAEEFGFIGILVLIILYVVFAVRGFFVAIQASDTEGCLLAASITFIITFQAFINLGVVSGLLPSKGVNLPFFSQGGSSIIANIMGIIILWDIASDKEKNNNNDRGNWRAPISSSEVSKTVIK